MRLAKNLNRPEEYNGFERWKEPVRLFVHLAAAYPRRVTLIRYADLLKDPVGNAARLRRTVGLDLFTQTPDFLERARDTGKAKDGNRYSVFRRANRMTNGGPRFRQELRMKSNEN
jgi:hypothetical protein